MRVRIIDYDKGQGRRGTTIKEAIESLSGPDQLAVVHSASFFGDKQTLGAELETDAERPSLVVCHANDLWDPTKKKLAADYIAKCTQEKCMLILYCGSGVSQESSPQTPSHVSITTNQIRSPNNEIEGLVQGYLCTIRYSVMQGNDLPIGNGLKLYFSELSKGEEAARGAFFDALRQFDPVLEAKLEFLYECLDACHDPDPGKLAYLENQDNKSWKTIKEACASAETAWEGLKKAGAKDDKPEALLGERLKALETLRNVLLGE